MSERERLDSEWRCVFIEWVGDRELGVELTGLQKRSPMQALMRTDKDGTTEVSVRLRIVKQAGQDVCMGC